MKKDKERLFEIFEKVNKNNLKEWDRDAVEREMERQDTAATTFTNQELHQYVKDLLWKLKYYDNNIAADIMTNALEEKYPQLKQ